MQRIAQRKEEGSGIETTNIFFPVHQIAARFIFQKL